MWWKGAVKQVTKPRRNMRVRKKKGKTGQAALLPWRLPKPLSLDAQMWADYRLFKAAGLLNEWFSLYRHVLNLKPSFMQVSP